MCSTPVPQSFIVTPILPQHVRTVRAGIWNAARVPAAKVRSLHNRVGFLGPEAAARRIMNPPFVSTPSTAPDFIVWNVSTTATKWSIPLVGSTPPLPPLREAVTIPVGKTNINWAPLVNGLKLQAREVPRVTILTPIGVKFVPPRTEQSSTTTTLVETIGITPTMMMIILGMAKKIVCSGTAREIVLSGKITGRMTS